MLNEIIKINLKLCFITCSIKNLAHGNYVLISDFMEYYWPHDRSHVINHKFIMFQYLSQTTIFNINYNFKIVIKLYPQTNTYQI